jgi:hypothetical protein
MGKLYVDVLIYVNKDGKIIPKQIKAEVLGEWVRIDKVLDSRRRASLKAGGIGIRHTCVVHYNEMQREIYLYDEGQKWFIETED